MKVIQTININNILLTMLIIFILQDNTIVVVIVSLKTLKEWLAFDDLSYVLKDKQDVFFFFSIQNIKSNYCIIFLRFFPITFFLMETLFLPSYLYLLIQGLIFVIFCRSCFISFWFNATVTAYWKHLLSFSLMGFIVAFRFLSNQENLYMMHLNLDLFYNIL